MTIQVSQDRRKAVINFETHNVFITSDERDVLELLFEVRFSDATDKDLRAYNAAHADEETQPCLAA